MLRANQFTRVGFIYNPKANKGKCETEFLLKIKPLIELYFGPQRTHAILATEKVGGAFDRAIQLYHEKCDLVVACGGDGTLSEVINGIKFAEEQQVHIMNDDNLENAPVRSLETSSYRPAVGVITLGTSDDFASHIQMVKKSATTTQDRKKTKYEDQYEEMIKVLSETGCVTSVDLGYVEATPVVRLNNGRFQKVSDDQPKKQSYFVNIASFGVCADITDNLNTASHLWNKALYSSFQAIWKQFTYTNKWIEIQFIGLDGEQGKDKVECRLHQATAVGNGSTYGNGLKICPHSSIVDGLFSVCRLGDIGIRDIPILTKIYTGGHIHIGHKEIFTDKCMALEARCAQKNENDLVLVETDGEVIGALPARFTVRTKAFELVVPEHMVHSI